MVVIIFPLQHVTKAVNALFLLNHSNLPTLIIMYIKDCM